MAIETSMPQPCANSPWTNRRWPPAATLFMVIIDRMVTVGNGLNCMVAAQKPPSNESSSMLRCSAWYGNCALLDKR
ncbi:hypothetical protein D3C75_945300 [compost metagenome]